jgi:hypothetical protein
MASSTSLSVEAASAQDSLMNLTISLTSALLSEMFFSAFFSSNS